MDWANEKYVRLYIRDTKTWLKLAWEGQCLFMLLLRKVDRAGVLDDIEDRDEDIALMTGLPVEYVSIGLKKLLKLGAVEINGNYLLIPNFLEAQESSKSDKQRQRESREKRRLLAKESVTFCDNKSQAVTSSHNLSQPVTPSCAVPSRTVPNKSKRIKKPTEYSEEFITVWKVYPMKKGKAKAFEYWANVPTDIYSQLPGIIEAQKKDRERQTTQGEFVAPWPHFSTWLNQRRWEDETTMTDDEPEIIPGVSMREQREWEKNNG